MGWQHLVVSHPPNTSLPQPETSHSRSANRQGNWCTNHNIVLASSYTTTVIFIFVLFTTAHDPLLLVLLLSLSFAFGFYSYYCILDPFRSKVPNALIPPPLAPSSPHCFGPFAPRRPSMTTASGSSSFTSSTTTIHISSRSASLSHSWRPLMPTSPNNSASSYTTT